MSVTKSVPLSHTPKITKPEELIYQGSVKRLVKTTAPGLIAFCFSNDYSVFDYGKMPDELPGKGNALAKMGADIFQWLASQHNIKTHFSSYSENMLFVQQYPVFTPTRHKYNNEVLHQYPRGLKGARMLPLEVVFRFAAPVGSSYYERAKVRPKPEDRFSPPVIEFFSKLEDRDRYFSPETALHYADINIDQLNQLTKSTVLIAGKLKELFALCGLELLDGKLEWAINEQGELILADAVGPDELRLVHPATGATFSKEYLRQFYKDTDWYKQMTAFKLKADEQWREKSGTPPLLSTHAKTTASEMYTLLSNAVACAVTGMPTPGVANEIDNLARRITHG